MAKVQITTANNNSLNGGRAVVRTSAGTLYTVILDETDGGVEVWKSTNGTSWTEQDTANNPQNANYIAPSCAIDSSDVIHISYYNSNGASSTIRYVTFDTSTDTFSGDVQVHDVGVDSPNNPGTAISIDSSDIPHIAWTDSNGSVNTITHSSTTVATSEGTTSLTISSHVVSGTDPVLIVKVACKGVLNEVTSVKWDSAGVNQSLIRLNSDVNGNADAEIWFLANPTAKTADITIAMGSSTRVVAAASTYTGVNQTSPFRTAASASANGTDASPTVNVVALANEMVVDSLCQVSAGPDTATGDHTERHDDAAVSGGTDTRGASQEKASTGATETMGWAMSGSDNWAICAGALQQVSGIDTIYYTNRVGGTWNTEVEIEGFTALKVCVLPDITISDEDVPDICYLNATDAYLGAALENVNNATSFTLNDVDTNVSDLTKNTPSIAIDSSGNTWIAYLFASGDTKLKIIQHLDANAWNSWETPITLDDAENLSEPSLVIDGSDRYVFVKDINDEDVYYYKNSDARVSLEVGGFIIVRAKWSFNNNNGGATQIDYVFRDGSASPDIFWNKLDLAGGSTTQQALAATEVGVLALVTAAIFPKTMAGTEIAILSMTRSVTTVITLAVIEVSLIAIAKVSSFLKTLASTAGSAATIIKKSFTTLATTSPGTATITAAAIFSKALSVIEISVATIAKAVTTVKTLSIVESSIATISTIATFARTLSVTESAIAGLSKVSTFFKSLTATAVSVAVMAQAAITVTTLSVVESSTATLARVATFARTLAIAEVSIGTLTKISSYLRTLAVTVTSVLTIVATKTAFMTLSVVELSIGTLAKVAEHVRTLAATEVSIATLTKVASHLRTLSVVEVSVVTMAIVRTALRTLAATVVSVPTMARATITVKTLSVVEASIATLTRVAQYLRTLAVVEISVVTLTRVASHFRTLAVTQTAIATMATARTVITTLTATAASAASIAKVKTALVTLSVIEASTITITTVAQYLRTLAVVEVSVMTLAKASSYFRTLSVSMVSVVTLGTLFIQGVILQTLSASAGSVATISAVQLILRTLVSTAGSVVTMSRATITTKTISVTESSVVALTRIASHFRTLAIQMVSVSTLAKVVSHFRTLAVVEIAVTNIEKVKTIITTLAVQAVSLATIATVSAFTRTLSAIGLSVTTIGKVASYFITIATTEISVTTLATVFTGLVRKGKTVLLTTLKNIITTTKKTGTVILRMSKEDINVLNVKSKDKHILRNKNDKHIL